MGKTYDVKFTVTLPDGVEATEQQIEKWVEFELHARTVLEANPVSKIDLRADKGSVSVMESW